MYSHLGAVHGAATHLLWTEGLWEAATRCKGMEWYGKFILGRGQESSSTYDVNFMLCQMLVKSSVYSNISDGQCKLCRIILLHEGVDKEWCIATLFS